MNQVKILLQNMLIMLNKFLDMSPEATKEHEVMKSKFKKNLKKIKDAFFSSTNAYTYKNLGVT